MKSVHVMYGNVIKIYFPLWRIVVWIGIASLGYCDGQNLKPTLTITSKAVLLNEAQTAPMTLTEMQCVGPNGGQAVLTKDKVVPGKPCSSCFNVVPCNNNAEYCLDFTRMDDLDMAKASSYTVTVKCVDQNRQAVKDFIMVHIYKLTKPPEFLSHARVVTLDEMETQEVVLQKVTCHDPDNTTIKVDLTLDPKSPKAGCSKCFSVEPCGAEWCLKFIPAVGSISFSVVPSYKMTLTCSDQEGQEVTSDIEVRVTKNSPPHFDKMFASTTVQGASNVKAGAILFQTNATDQEHDALYYTMTTTPDIPQLAIGFTDGALVATGDLSQVCTPVVSCEVKVSDGINPEVGPMVIDLTLQDANTSPSITNMDETVQLPEDTAVGSAVYKINILDEDKISDMTLTLKVNPPSSQGHFELNGDEISLKSAMNYEDTGLRTTQLSLIVTDSGGCSSTTKTLTLLLTDVNEPPEMENEKISMIIYEGMINLRPDWSVKDEDFVDTKTYSITSGNDDGRFAIDSSTGVITSIVDYDVDRGRMPRKRTFGVEVKDKGGLTAEGEVTLSIRDANDNNPFVRGGSQHFVVTECTMPGASLTVLVTDDYDSYYQFNSRVHFLPTRDGSVSLLASGEVVLTSPMQAGDTASMEAWVADAGKYPGPLKSIAPVYITVRCTPCPTTTTTIPPHVTWATGQGHTLGVVGATAASVGTSTPAHTRKKHEWDVLDNLWWMIVAGLLGVAMLALTSWMCWKVRCCAYAGSACRRCPAHPRKPKVTKVRPHTPEVKRWDTPAGDTKVNLDLKRPPPPSPLPPSKPPNMAPVLDIPPPETPELVTVGPDGARIYDFWKERYNEEDYPSHPDRNTKPQPPRDAVNPLDHPGSDGDPTQGGDKSTTNNKNKCLIL